MSRQYWCWPDYIDRRVRMLENGCVLRLRHQNLSYWPDFNRQSPLNRWIDKEASIIDVWPKSRFPEVIYLWKLFTGSKSINLVSRNSFSKLVPKYGYFFLQFVFYRKIDINSESFWQLLSMNLDFKPKFSYYWIKTIRENARKWMFEICSYFWPDYPEKS